MKKSDLKKLALLGITGGVMLGAQCQAGESNTSETAGLSADQVLAAQGRCGGHYNDSYRKEANCGGYGGQYKSSHGREASCGGCGAEPNESYQTNGWQQYPSNQHHQREQMYNQNYGPYESKEITNIQSLPLKTSNRNKLVSQNDAMPSTMQQRQITSESELRAQLSEEGRRMFDRLDADGKRLALKLANQTPGSQNLDEAVRAAAKKMEEKQPNINPGSQTNYRAPGAKKW